MKHACEEMYIVLPLGIMSQLAVADLYWKMIYLTTVHKNGNI